MDGLQGVIKCGRRRLPGYNLHFSSYWLALMRRSGCLEVAVEREEGRLRPGHFKDLAKMEINWNDAKENCKRSS